MPCSVTDWEGERVVDRARGCCGQKASLSLPFHAHTKKKSLLTEHHRITHVHEELGMIVYACDPSSREVEAASHGFKAV